MLRGLALHQLDIEVHEIHELLDPLIDVLSGNLQQAFDPELLACEAGHRAAHNDRALQVLEAVILRPGQEADEAASLMSTLSTLNLEKLEGANHNRN